MKWFVMGYLDIKRPSQNFKYPILYGLGVRFRKFIKVLLKIKHDVGSKFGTVSAQSCINNGCEDYCGRSPSQEFNFAIHKTNKKFLAELEVNVKKVKEWRAALESIRQKTASKDFVKSLEAVGLKALGEIKAIDKMTKTELQEYLDLHNEIHKEVLLMPKEKMLNQGIELLKGLDLSNAEGVNINTTTYDDGSSLVEVGVAYPVPNVEVNEIQSKNRYIFEEPNDADTAER